MAAKLKTIVKLNLPAGSATPAPPVGSVLGQHGISIMDFVKQFNDRTASLKGDIIPAVISIYEDRTFNFITKKPPVSNLIKKTLGIEKGSTKPGKEIISEITDAQLNSIAEIKMVDLNANTTEAAKLIIAGTARSMGIKIAK